jgi:hypothetical protein
MDELSEARKHLLIGMAAGFALTLCFLAIFVLPWYDGLEAKKYTFRSDHVLRLRDYPDEPLYEIYALKMWQDEHIFCMAETCLVEARTTTPPRPAVSSELPARCAVNLSFLGELRDQPKEWRYCFADGKEMVFTDWH